MTNHMREVPPKGQRKFEIESVGKQQQNGVRIKRSLADMPVPARELNVISVVCLYSLIGLSERDIAEALKIDVDRVARVKMLDAYTTVYDYVTKSIIDEDSEDVAHLFAAHARTAAKSVVDLATDPDGNSAVRLRASQDILDRAGHRPIDRIQIQGQLDHTLKVVYVEDEQSIGVIDGEAVQVEER